MLINEMENPMTTAVTLIATVESSHTIKVPIDLPVGERVLVMPIPSIAVLLNDTARRVRFAATRKAIQAALTADSVRQFPSNEEIVSLVKRARKSTRPR